MDALFHTGRQRTAAGKLLLDARRQALILISGETFAHDLTVGVAECVRATSAFVAMAVSVFAVLAAVVIVFTVTIIAVTVTIAVNLLTLRRRWWRRGRRSLRAVVVIPSLRVLGVRSRRGARHEHQNGF